MKRNSIFLSGLLSLAIVLSSFSFTFGRDEGMYMPDQIAALGLEKRGMTIRPEEIYNPKGGGLSEAVIRLSVGCTAEFVSPAGLILTNHHCAFDSLVTASTPDRDLIEDGFRTDNRAGELPAKGFSIFITERSQNVTDVIRRGTDSLSGTALSAALAKNVEALQAAEKVKAPAGTEIRVQSLNNGYYYYLFQIRQIKDIRVVYAPPRNIGVFGGDPDNFEWTRHTGDFTFLRAYVAPDGSAADYSADNVPYKPSRFLTMNIGGLKEDDFVFVLGFPGGTTRYRESSSVEYARDTFFPFLASWLDARADALRLVGEGDEAKRIALQSDIANFDNSRKVYEGGAQRIRRANVAERRRAEEGAFTKWIAADAARKAKYGNVLSEIAAATAVSNRYAARDAIVRRIPEAMMKVFGLVTLAVIDDKPLADADRPAKLEQIRSVLADHEPVYEREMLKFFLHQLAELPDDQKVEAVENLFGSKKGAERRKAEADFAELVAEGDYWNAETILALYGPQTMEYWPERDDVKAIALGIAQARAEAEGRAMKFASQIDRLRLLYQQGMAEMKGTTPYPDANSTQRFSFGSVKGYSPREAEYRSPFTTIKGMIEKDTGINPFDMPQKLKDLQAAKDFGRFGSGDSVVVNFISDNDIIGGNSGSPVLNGAGEQVGLVFDGNYEGLGNDFFYDPARNRTISVDIRFVLFVTEKFGNAGWILDEMRIVGGR